MYTTWCGTCKQMAEEVLVRAFNETKAKTMIPLYCGTFNQADKPLSEPPKVLLQLEKAHKTAQQLKILKLGEVFFV